MAREKASARNVIRAAALPGLAVLVCTAFCLGCNDRPTTYAGSPVKVSGRISANGDWDDVIRIDCNQEMAAEFIELVRTGTVAEERKYVSMAALIVEYEDGEEEVFNVTHKCEVQWSDHFVQLEVAQTRRLLERMLRECKRLPNDNSNFTE